MFFSGFSGFGASPGGGFSFNPAADRGASLDTLYAALELESSASVADVRKAYRRLAVIHHPDKGGNVEKFREISEAYEVLCNPQKRKEREAGAPSDVFADLFRSAAPRRQQKSPDVVHELRVTLEELYRGCLRNVEVLRSTIDASTAPHACATCGGTGAVSEVRNLGPISQHLRTRCGACSGHGTRVATLQRSEVLDVYVPRGASEGQALRIRGKAHELPHMECGDAVFVLRQEPHSELRREGADLYAQRSISLVEALCGFRIALVHLDGRKLALHHAGVFSPRKAPTLTRSDAVAWESLPDSDCPQLETVAVAQTADVSVLQRACLEELRAKGLAVEAFVVEGGHARFLRGSREEAKANLVAKPGATLHIVAPPTPRTAADFLLAAVGEGMPQPGAAARGNLFLELEVVFPAGLSEEQRETIRTCFGEQGRQDLDCDEDILLTNIDPVASFEARAKPDSGDAEDPPPQGAQPVQCHQQ